MFDFLKLFAHPLHPRDNPSRQLSKQRLVGASIIVGATIVCFVLFGFYVFRVYEGLKRTTNEATENSIWVVGQVEPNSLNFQLALNDYLGAPSDLQKEKRLKLTAGVLMSRMDIVEAHISQRDLALREELLEALKSILHIKPKLLQIVTAESRGDTLLASQAVTNELPIFMAQVRSFAVKSMRLAADLAATDRRNLWSLVNRFALAAFVLVILFVTSLFMMIYSWMSMTHTRTKEAEARESLQKTYNLSSEGILIVDRYAKVVTVNPAASEMFGLTDDDLNDTSVLHRIFVDYPDINQIVWNILKDGFHQDIVINEGMTRRIETSGRSKDGTILKLDVLTARDRDSYGNPVLVLFMRDVTAQIAREDDLREARDEAVRAVDSRIRFFAAMSHEMRTPISGAIAALDAINVRTSPNTDQRRLLGIAEKSAHAALDQINNVLDLAWVERGDFQLDIEEFNYVDVIEEAVDQFRPLAQSVGTVFELELADRESTFVKGPLRVFMRPLNNLLGNAIKHTQNGTITVRAADFNGKVRIEVEDTGTGVSEEDRERIFEPFIMGTSGQFAATQSSGLGLPIAKRAVESMGGEMGYNSKKGYGSLFWFTCLLETSNTYSDQEIIKIDAKETHLEISGTLNAEVLLVEDHEASRVLACEMLEWHGLDVTIARNGLEAVEIATSKKFTTILMDVNMPVMDGLIATQQIRKSGASVSARIIGVTAYGAPDEVSRFLLSGMDQVISKPLTNHDLHSIFKASQINLPSSVENIVGSEKMDIALDSLRTEVKTLLDQLVILDDKDELDELDELDEMADEAHRVKGLASILQFSKLARFVSVCETHLRKGRRADARSLVGEIRKAMSTEALHYERDRKQP